ncbi:MAG: PilZ domain-containing protein [Candidatus Omnitrophota bacterium]
MVNSKLKRIVIVFFTMSLLGIIYGGVSLAQDSARSPEYLVSKDGMRIIISASGPVKFNSYWLDNPFRLIIEFQTKNIISKMKEEIAVNQGVIKRISSAYFEKGNDRSLKSLTFELMEKVPYKILQEADMIILDIQTSADLSVFPEGGKEIFAKNEPKEVILERLDAMGSALTMDSVFTKATANHFLSEAFPEAITEFPETRKKTMGIVFWFTGLTLVFGLGGFLFWRRHKLIFDKNASVREIENLKSQIEERNKLLEQEKIIRKMVENTSLVREKEFEQFKLELQRKTELLEEEKARKAKEEVLLKLAIEKEIEQLKSEFQRKAELLEEEKACQAKEEELLKKEIEPEQPENDFDPLTQVLPLDGGLCPGFLVLPAGLSTGQADGCTKGEKTEIADLSTGLHSLKEAFVDRALEEEVFSSREEEKLLTVEKTSENRQFFRSDLSKDYNRTIILRIESPGKSKSIKSFANNIGLRGLCFETRRDFEEKEAINLRLFFFGDKVPILKIKAEIVWKKTVFPVHYYGVSFVSMEEKDKKDLSRYMESRITKG